MFDELVKVASRAAEAEAIAAWAKVEAAACARRLAAMVVLLDRCYAADGSADREQWCLDNWDAVCAQIAAAEQITSGLASRQLLVATALRDRLPRVAAQFAAGTLSYRVVSAIVWRTALIKDSNALRDVDAAVADASVAWGAMSAKKMEMAIDYWVDRCDPDALRRCQSRARSRSFEIGSEDATGMASLWGTLFAHDAKALDQRIDAIARTVCDGDGRTLDQRRADAAGALANGLAQLACRCGSDDCVPPTPLGRLVIHVVANAEDVATDDGALDGADPRVMPDKPLRQMTLVEALSQPPATGPAAEGPGFVMGRLAGARQRDWANRVRSADQSDRASGSGAAGAAACAIAGIGGFRQMQRSDLSISRVRPPGRCLRHRSHDRLSSGPYTGVQLEYCLSKTSLGQDLLVGTRWLARRTAARRHRDVAGSGRSDVQHPARQPAALPAAVHADGCRVHFGGRHPDGHRPDHAAAGRHPCGSPGPTRRRRTPTESATASAELVGGRLDPV